MPMRHVQSVPVAKEKTMRHRFVLGARALTALLGLALFLGACSYGNDDTDTLGTDPYVTEGGTPRVFAQFEPGVQIMPLPNDVVWAADADPADPGVQLPASGALAQLAPVINSLGLLGFSPNMFLTVPVTGEVDPATLQAFVFRLDGQDFRTSANFQVIADPIVDNDPTTPAGVLKLLPNTPFAPGAFYAVAIKMGLEDASGFAVHPSLTMQALKSPEPFSADSPFASLERLRLSFNQGGLFDGLAQATGAVLGTPWTRSDVLVLWTFHTAAVTLDLPPDAATPPGALAYADFDVPLQTFRGLSAALPADPGLVWLNPADGTPVAAPLGIPASVALGGVGLPDISNLGSLYAGAFQSPDLATGGAQTTAVPFVLLTPAAGAAPYPVVVYQHGLGLDKTTAFAVANALAGRGLAVFAIDAPYHGDRAPIDPDTGLPLPSGTGFFTANLLLDRLNVYQAAVDLWKTVDLIVNTGIDLDGAEGADLTSPRFVSHSLGSIIGSAYLSQDSRPEAILLCSPSAGLANVLDATTISSLQGLVASLGYQKGRTDYYVFLDLAQWLLDPIDGAYTGIGTNAIGKLLAIFAYADPRVSADSSKTFLAGLGLDPAADVVSVDPAEIVPGTFPDFSAPAYEYGIAGHPIIHSFFLTPQFDLAEEPWYAGYLPADQLAAWMGAQAQAAGFLAP
jgi:hypothetical protein